MACSGRSRSPTGPLVVSSSPSKAEHRSPGDGKPALGSLAEIGANLVESLALRVAAGKCGDGGGVAACVGLCADNRREDNGGIDGVTVGVMSRRWEEFEYAVSRGYLVIVPAGDGFGWADRVEIALVDIPNPLVLLELIVRLGKPPTDPMRMIPKADRARLAR